MRIISRKYLIWHSYIICYYTIQSTKWA